MQATGLACLSVTLCIFGIHTELIGHRAEEVEVIIHMSEDWFGMCLNLVSYDAGPGSRVDQNQVSVALLKPAAPLIEGLA